MKIVTVDGFAIRQLLDTEFGLLHSHCLVATEYAPKFYIPSEETWIGKRFLDELEFLLWVERELAGKVGKGYQEKRAEMRQRLGDKKDGGVFTVETGKVDDCLVRYVRGEGVRRELDPEFVFGGNGFVYDYVPKNEVWIDVKVDPKEIPFVLLHELTERKLMMSEKKSYDVAHDMAVAVEKEERRTHGAKYPGDADYDIKEGELWEKIKISEISR